MKTDGAGIGGRGLLIASIIFILIVGAAFFAITSGMFGGGDRDADERVLVTDVLDGRSVRMIVNGPVVAEEDRRAYQIEVGPDSRKVEVLQGYEKSVADTGIFTNSHRAYTEFVYALQRAGFDERRNVSGIESDERGVCANGRQYIFEVLHNGRSLNRAWTTSCSKSAGTLDADARKLKELFDAQVPEDSKILDGLKLR